MRRGLVWLLAVLLSGLAIGDAFAHAAHHHHRHRPFPVSQRRHGYDVSWPQCSGGIARHMPSGSPSFAVLGLTDGSGQTVNPCLSAQLAWARSHHVRTGAYLVPSYPVRSQRRVARQGARGNCRHTLRCVLHRDGMLQARDALATLHRAGVHAPRIWIDVEFRHYHPWHRHNAANRAVVRGVVDGLRHHHMAIGVYTTSYMWHAILGRYHLHVPNWLPVGHGGPRKALRMCRTSATGGVTWLAQYTRALDSDLTCPALAPRPGHRSSLWSFRLTTQHLLSRGSAVRAIQRRLKVRETGVFGPPTMLAVTRWQRAKGLPATGRVTPRDWRALGAYRRHGGHGLQLGRFARR